VCAGGRLRVSTARSSPSAQLSRPRRSPRQQKLAVDCDGFALGSFLGNNCPSLRPSGTVWTGCISKKTLVRRPQTSWNDDCQTISSESDSAALAPLHVFLTC